MPPSRTPTLSPTATTLLGNASISTGRWKLPTRHKTPLPTVEPLQQGRTPGNDGQVNPLCKKKKPRNLRSYGSSKKSSMKIASALSCLNRSLSRISHTRQAEVSADGLQKYIDRSSETGSLSSPSAVSLEQARTSWRQQCCHAICPNHRTPKRDAFEIGADSAPTGGSLAGRELGLSTSRSSHVEA